MLLGKMKGLSKEKFFCVRKKPLFGKNKQISPAIFYTFAKGKKGKT